jgi:hypothetical protein
MQEHEPEQEKERNENEHAGHIITKTYDPPNQPISIAHMDPAWPDKECKNEICTA